MVKEYWERENYKEEVCADNEEGSSGELVHETKHRCQEVVGETILIRETLDSGETDKRLKVKEVENK
ncbi:auxilin-like protein, partial [Trifolium medium]|nr:auxilin-like protein [Trifolium medium]